MTKKQATLLNGSIVDYIESDDPPSGGMKRTYFSPDRSYVIQFFHDQKLAKDPQQRSRLESILGKYNPTIPESQGGAKGTSVASAEYFKKLFCWPTAIVIKPEFGIMAPTYPSNYFFATGPWQGQEKNGKWFSSPKLRNYLPAEERGTFIHYLSMSIMLARAVRRFHQAGLAHSDLSCNNVLNDPITGQCVVIDIDSLVVPMLYPPDVMGTPGYIAPEVLATQHLPLSDENKKLPRASTDQHALAVLIYEYLLFRHPLRGPKVNSSESTEKDELLSMGSKALFVEDSKDKTNLPDDIKVKYEMLGPYLKDMFEKAFVDGLHEPVERPAAIEWEKALTRTWDLLYPCEGKACSNKWFVIADYKRTACPFCGSKIKSEFPVLKLRKESRQGQWVSDGDLVLYNNSSLFNWHIFSGIFPGEEADRTPQAYVVFHNGQWLLINQRLTSLTSPSGNRVGPGQAIALKDGIQIRLSQEEHGRIAEVMMIRN
jgi:serine/threonine protein kinase